MVLMISTVRAVLSSSLFVSISWGSLLKIESRRHDSLDNAVEVFELHSLYHFLHGHVLGVQRILPKCGVTKYSMNMSVGRLWVLRLPII